MFLPVQRFRSVLHSISSHFLMYRVSCKSVNTLKMQKSLNNWCIRMRFLEKSFSWRGIFLGWEKIITFSYDRWRCIQTNLEKYANSSPIKCKERNWALILYFSIITFAWVNSDRTNLPYTMFGRNRMFTESASQCCAAIARGSYLQCGFANEYFKETINKRSISTSI